MSRTPKQTLLYKTVRKHWQTFQAHVDSHPNSRGLPSYVAEEFEEYLKCGILAHGFLRLQCQTCKKEKLLPFSCKRRGFCPSCGSRRMAETAAQLVDKIIPQVAIRQWVISFPISLRYWMSTNPKLMSKIHRIVVSSIKQDYLGRAKLHELDEAKTGSISFIQRFSSSLSLNVHFHILFCDGIFYPNEDGISFRKLFPPTDQNIQDTVSKISLRVIKLLRRKGYLGDHDHEPCDDTPTHPLLEGHEELQSFLAASVQNRVAMGDRAGQKVQKIGCGFGYDYEQVKVTGSLCAKVNNFSLHAGVWIKAKRRKQLERLIRYVSRPALALKRLSEDTQGNLVYELKKPWSDGTTHVKFTPMEFMEKLAALVPLPRVNLVRYSGVLAPHSKDRPQVIVGNSEAAEQNPQTRAPSAQRISWAQLLKRVFAIDMEECEFCRGSMKIIAPVIESKAITKILDHLGYDSQAPPQEPTRLPEYYQQDFQF